MEGDLRALFIKHEPPSITKDGCAADVDTNHHIAEEEPASNKGLTTISGRNSHDRMICGIEAQGGGG